MKPTVITLMALLLMSCTTVYVPHAVTEVEFGPGNCADKAATLQMIMAAQGEASPVCAGFTGTTGDWTAHAWVEVWSAEDSQWHLLELGSVGNSDGWPVSQYPEYAYESVWYGLPTAGEIRRDVAPDWQSDKTKSELISELPVGREPTASEGKYLGVR